MKSGEAFAQLDACVFSSANVASLHPLIFSLTGAVHQALAWTPKGLVGENMRQGSHITHQHLIPRILPFRMKYILSKLPGSFLDQTIA